MMLFGRLGEEASGSHVDLEDLATGLSGRQRIERLLFVAQQSSSSDISQEALSLGLSFLKSETFDAKRYASFHRGLPLDIEWIEGANATAKERLSRLEMELKGFKATHIKESIRVAYMDLGNCYASMGDAQNALKHFGLARDYATSGKQTLDSLMASLDVSLWSKAYSQVSVFCSKAQALLESIDKGSPLRLSLKTVSGLVALQMQNYGLASDLFLSIPFASSSELSAYVTPQDVALYGTLSSLLTMDRLELKTKVMENSDFRHFLELTPSLWELLESLYDAKYAHCLLCLNKVQGEWRLHPLLHDHVHFFLSTIQVRIVKQYLAPFHTTDLRKMAQTFQIDLPTLEGELVSLIQEGTLSRARLDAVQGVLVHKKRTSFQGLTKKDLVRQSVEVDRLRLRIQLLENGLVVKGH